MQAGPCGLEGQFGRQIVLRAAAERRRKQEGALHSWCPAFLNLQRRFACLIGLVEENRVKSETGTCRCIIPFHDMQPANVSKGPSEVTKGEALQQLNADLEEEGGKAPRKSILGMVEHKDGSSYSLCHTEQPVTCQVWEGKCCVSDLQMGNGQNAQLWCRKIPLTGILGCINFTSPLLTLSCHSHPQLLAMTTKV